MPLMSDREFSHVSTPFVAHLPLMALSYFVRRPEDVRHPSKSRETHKDGAGLMRQARIRAPPNFLRRGNSPIKCFA
jgi:hypothetical protein